jgi:hypothetical protein
MTPTRVRILTLCASSLVTACLVAGFLVWFRRRPPADTVKFVQVDNDALNADTAVKASAKGEPEWDPSKLQVDIPLPLFPPSTLKRRPLTDAEFRLLYPGREGSLVYDPQTHFRYRGGNVTQVKFPEHPQGGFTARTNSLGMREETEVLERQPDLRVLVTGDSHTDGVCDERDSYTNVLERALASARPGKTVEALNTGVGGYSFYNYLGVLERYLPLAPDVFVVGVYGGNDFEEMLTVHHYFQGTPRLAGLRDYGWQLTQAAKVLVCIGQAWIALKYFEHNPSEIDIALQGARDVSTEIVVTCMRNGIHPIFLYIPPMHSVEYNQHRGLFEKLAEVLQLKPEDVRITDRMADSYLAYLRSIHVDVVDMRKPFTAAKTELYWQTDHHINLKAHELIAGALFPVVDAACPAGATRLRPIGTRTDFAALEGGAAPSPPAGAEPDSVAKLAAASGAVPVAPEPAFVAKPLKVSDEPLKPIALSAEAVEQLFALRADQEYDARSLFRYASKLARDIDGVSFATNSSGLLGAEEPRISQPNVLLLGDETVFAPGDTGSTCGALIERAQADVKCLDACTAGYGLFNYLGTLERLSDQKPVEVVVVVDTTTDVVGVMPVYRATQLERDRKRAPKEPRSLQDKRRDDALPKPGQDRLVRAAKTFHENAGNLLVATRYAAEVVLEIGRRCKSRGVPLTVVVVPPASDPRVRGVEETIAKAVAAMPGSDDDLAALSRSHASFIATLKAHEVNVVDFGTTLEQAPAPLIDAATLRLNAGGRAALAELIARSLTKRR